MNFLTRVSIDKDVAFMKGFSNPNDWHKAIWNLFKEDEKREFLFNIKEKENFIELLVYSTKKLEYPDWGIWKTIKFPKNFLGYANYHFELTANPTIRQGKRRAVLKEEDLKNWIKRKGEYHGFKIENLEISKPSCVQFKKKKNLCTYNSITFKGILKVIDSDVFKKSFYKGIGSGKAFGFGMLKVIPQGVSK